MLNIITDNLIMVSLLYNLFHYIKSGKYSEYNNPQKFVMIVAKRPVNLTDILTKTISRPVILK